MENFEYLCLLISSEGYFIYFFGWGIDDKMFFCVLSKSNWLEFYFCSTSYLLGEQGIGINMMWTYQDTCLKKKDKENTPDCVRTKWAILRADSRERTPCGVLRGFLESWVLEGEKIWVDGGILNRGVSSANTWQQEFARHFQAIMTKSFHSRSELMLENHLWQPCMGLWD